MNRDMAWSALRRADARREAGISSGIIYSYHFREVLSMARTDLEHR
jgi:hypothetical protein